MCRSMMELDFADRLGKITCPVLVVCGEKDSANKKASMELEKQIEHAQIRMITRAGHEVNADVPEELANVLQEFWI